MSNIPTPHINAIKGDFAKVVLMPGDPLRSKFIAENFLEDAVLVNNIRGVQGYTGYYGGERVSVMASGMGMPSIGIYSHELYNFYDVECIIRVGSAGAMQENVKVRDLVFGMGACTNSAYAEQYGLGGTLAPICDFEMLKCACEIAEQKGIRYHVGNIMSSDTFYDQAAGGMKWCKMGILAVEMEAAALYMNAMQSRKRALAICTVSDSMLTGECTTAEERQTTFTDMMSLALEVAKKFAK